MKKQIAEPVCHKTYMFPVKIEDIGEYSRIKRIPATIVAEEIRRRNLMNKSLPDSIDNLKEYADKNRIPYNVVFEEFERSIKE